MQSLMNEAQIRDNGIKYENVLLLDSPEIMKALKC